MDSKARIIAIISYFTLLGWAVAFLLHKTGKQKKALVSFHLNQSLGLMIVAFVGWYLALWVAGMLSFGALMDGFRLAVLVYWVLGIIYAIREGNETNTFYRRIF